MDGSAIGTFLTNAFKPLVGFWNQLSGARRRLLIVLVVALLAVAGFLSWFLNRTQYAVLYTDLTPADAGAILQQLADRKVEARAQGSDTILVPRQQIDKLRMDLAASGYPKSGSSLDILQQGTGFGMTEDDKAIYRRYQLQQDLQNAIKTFASVADARVSLIIPEKSGLLIQSQRTPATAAVLLTLRPGASLGAANVRAIAELVGKSVPDLKPEGITIIDNNMNVLNSEGGSGDINAKDQIAMEQQVRDRLKKQVLSLLQPIFGIDRVLAEVSVRLNFDSGTVESVRFEPAGTGNSGVISSIEKIREAANQAAKTGGEAGTGSNGTAVPVYPVTKANDTVYEKNSEKIAYEISTIKESLTKAKGTIADLSVSVVLDGSAAANASYAENVRSLVAGAVGVSPEFITVAALPFNGKAAIADTFATFAQADDKALQWQRTRFFIVLGACVLLAVAFLAGILALLRGSRATVSEAYDLSPLDGARIVAPAGRAAVGAGVRATGLAAGLNAGSADRPGAALPAGTAFSLSLQPDGEPAGADEKAMAEHYVRANPELAANIIRGWLAEEPG